MLSFFAKKKSKKETQAQTHIKNSHFLQRQSEYEQLQLLQNMGCKKKKHTHAGRYEQLHPLKVNGRRPPEAADEAGATPLSTQGPLLQALLIPAKAPKINYRPATELHR